MTQSPVLPPPAAVGRRPRICSHPPYEHSWGPQAIELAAAAGLVLDPWQQDALTIMLGVRGDGRYACPEYGEMVPAQNGKGAILEARALAGLFLLDEHVIMWSTYDGWEAAAAFERVVKRLGNLGTQRAGNVYDVDGVPVKVRRTNGEEGLERLDTGAQLMFRGRGRTFRSARGHLIDAAFVDDAFTYTMDHHSALVPAMLTSSNPQIVYTSTPPVPRVRRVDGGPGEILYKLRARGEAGDPALGWRDWGLAGDLSHLDRVDLASEDNWQTVNPAMPDRVSVELVRMKYRMLSPETFAREQVGIWPQDMRDNAEEPAR